MRSIVGRRDAFGLVKEGSELVVERVQVGEQRLLRESNQVGNGSEKLLLQILSGVN